MEEQRKLFRSDGPETSRLAVEAMSEEHLRGSVLSVYRCMQNMAGVVTDQNLETVLAYKFSPSRIRTARFTLSEYRHPDGSPRFIEQGPKVKNQRGNWVRTWKVVQDA